MKKWEYKVILVRRQQVLKENYQTLKVYQSFDIPYLNELGEGGWELVSCYVDDEHIGKPANIIFKRPVAGVLTETPPILLDAAKPGQVRSKQKN